jgi:NAD(P)-dependent dehydrogenase (short-subunit alcohol dehydrogenase family)
MTFTMAGRNALITGGSKGLGLAIAETFLRAGANVAITARGAEALESARARLGTAGKGQVVAIAGDIRKAVDCESVFKAAVAGLGQVDVLVNNAGTSQRAPFEQVSDELWQDDLDLKLFAAIRLARLALPGMKARRFGRIINVLNTGAKAPPAEGAPTAVSRAAGMALTKVCSSMDCWSAASRATNGCAATPPNRPRAPTSRWRTTTPTWARGSPWAASAPRKSSPTRPCSSPRTRAPISTVRRSTSTAVSARWCDSGTERRSFVRRRARKLSPPVTGMRYYDNA